MGAALVQSVTVTGNAVSSISLVFANAVSSGSAIIIAHGYFASAGQLSTLTDNINNAGYAGRCFSTMSNAADTQVHVLLHDKLNISSGAGASTYRVSLNYTGNAHPSICAMEFSGGPFTFGSTGSSNGTSTSARGPILTASSSPLLIVSGAVNNSTGVFRSTVVGVGTYLATVDPTNANQILNVVYSTHSSLTQQLTHGLTASTRWCAAEALYTCLGSGGAITVISPWRMSMMGVQ